jgi:hypothetical protein
MTRSCSGRTRVAIHNLLSQHKNVVLLVCAHRHGRGEVGQHTAPDRLLCGEEKKTAMLLDVSSRRAAAPSTRLHTPTLILRQQTDERQRQWDLLLCRSRRQRDMT